MSYKIVQGHASLDNFISKLDLDQVKINSDSMYNKIVRTNYFNTLYNDPKHVIHTFTMTNGGSADLVYSNNAGSSFSVKAHFALVSFNVTLPNGIKNWDKEKKRVYRYEDLHVSTKNVQLIGFTIGDLLKYCYNNYDNTTYCEDAKENDKIKSFVKKALGIDTCTADIRQFIGTKSSNRGHDFISSCDHVHNYLKDKTTIEGNFLKLCNKIIYLDGNTVGNMITVNTDHKTNTVTKSINPSDCLKELNLLANKDFTMKIINYFLYNDLAQLKNRLTVHKFDTPVLMIDVIKELYEKDSESKSDYIIAYNMILKKINKHEESLLATKFPPAVFASIRKVPAEYPVYSLRNVYVKEWRESNNNKDDDITYIDDHNNKHFYSKKLKYIISKTEKTIPISHYGFYEQGHSSSNCYGQRREGIKAANFAKRTLKFDMMDQITNYFDDDYNDA